MPGTERSVRIPMPDGVELAATLYLPDAGEAQPCLLEALPYRKDDLTSSYAEGYRWLRDEHSYAVCRLDLRGTGSSGGDATDEYPEVERSDLGTVIQWLADREWCDGGVGMFGTSYSGFNALQVACERPAALKAICAIYASDDRWSDDVHWRGHALKLLDLVDYCHYMTAMNVLPPVPAEYGAGWREEWRRRRETNEPWVLSWLREGRDGPYWRAGSVRSAHVEDPGWERIRCPTMLVAGWADGYRNIAFRGADALRRSGVPHRLIAGPWAHADPATAIPGPRIDLDRELVAWWDLWLRGRGVHEDSLDVFVRTSSRPEPDLGEQAGYWARLGHANVANGDGEAVTSPPSNIRMSPGAPPLPVDPDVGTDAWIDCAGHLPWGLSGDQREDDARSLTWEADPPEHPVIGHPVARLRVSASAPAASLSVKLCDVFEDGTSALISRGTLDLAFRDGETPEPLMPGQVYDVTVVLDACAYQADAGHRLRVSVAGCDWPTTVAPPRPVTLTVHDGTVELPAWAGTTGPGPSFAPGAESSSEDPDGTTWTVTRDVLRRTTTCTVRHGSTYAVPHDGTAAEGYAGAVVVDRRTFDQRADAECTYRLTWPEAEVRVTSSMRVDVTEDGVAVAITTEAFDGDERVSRRRWTEHLSRRIL
ncbi:MAG: CocE/NonD family hydrolase [Marmoricola sp.]|nr:CocE/NonD family hydrolase [Marmoricola sp.]